MQTTDNGSCILNVDDFVYEYGNYGLYDRQKVVRVTPKRAYLDNGNILDRTGRGCKAYYTFDIKEIRNGRVAGLFHYRSETPHSIDEWFDKKAIERLKSYPFHKLDHNSLVALIEKLPTEEPRT